MLKPHWRKVFLSKVWQTKLTLIAVDEAHCISEWGEDFRLEYQQLSELRRLFKVPIMALTATSTVAVEGCIMQHLQLNDTDTDPVSRSSDRPNIFIQVMKRDSADYAVSLKWLIDHIKEHGKQSKKIVLYCRSISAVSEIFMTLKSCLGDKSYAGWIRDADHLLVEMYHKSTQQDSKDRILSNFKRSSGVIRCVIATIALGMGLDIRDIDMVAHIGCPKSILSYWQEAGRCARDGRQGLSLILYDNFSLSLKTTDRDMASIVKTSEMCLRQQIMDVLTVGERKEIVTTACDGCEHDRCVCSACRCCSYCCRKCHATHEIVLVLTDF